MVLKGRDNRKRLRAFDGFDYDATNILFVEKSTYVKNNLSKADFVSICNLLCIGYESNNLFSHIFDNLRRGMMLKNSVNADGEDDEYNDDNEGDNVGNNHDNER